MRLEPGKNATSSKALGALDAGRNLCRIVSEVIHQSNAVEGSKNLMATEHAGERTEGISAGAQTYAGLECCGCCGQCIFHVVTARQRNRKLHQFIVVTAAENDGRAFSAEIDSLNADVTFGTEVVVTILAKRLCQRVSVIHNQCLAVVQNVAAELAEDFLQFAHFLVVLVHVEDESNFRFVADQSSIAFVSFNYQPFASTANCITNLTFLLQVHKTGASHDRRL